MERVSWCWCWGFTCNPSFLFHVFLFALTLPCWVKVVVDVKVVNFLSLKGTLGPWTSKGRLTYLHVVVLKHFRNPEKLGRWTQFDERILCTLFVWNCWITTEPMCKRRLKDKISKKNTVASHMLDGESWYLSKRSTKNDNCSRKIKSPIGNFDCWRMSLSMSSHLLETKKTGHRTPSLKLTASLHRKMDGWNTVLVSFLGPFAYCQVRALLVSTKSWGSKVWKSIIFSGTASVNFLGCIPWVVPL